MSGEADQVVAIIVSSLTSIRESLNKLVEAQESQAESLEIIADVAACMDATIYNLGDGANPGIKTNLLGFVRQYRLEADEAEKADQQPPE